MGEQSGGNGEELSLTQQIEEGVAALEALSGSESYDHVALMTGYNTVVTLVDEAVAAGDYDQEQAANLKLAASNTAREIAAADDEETAKTLGQLADAHRSVIELLGTVQSQVQADTSRHRTGRAKSRL